MSQPMLSLRDIHLRHTTWATQEWTLLKRVQQWINLKRVQESPDTPCLHPILAHLILNRMCYPAQRNWYPWNSKKRKMTPRNLWHLWYRPRPMGQDTFHLLDLQSASTVSRSGCKILRLSPCLASRADMDIAMTPLRKVPQHRSLIGQMAKCYVNRSRAPLKYLYQTKRADRSCQCSNQRRYRLAANLVRNLINKSAKTL